MIRDVLDFNYCAPATKGAANPAQMECERIKVMAQYSAIPLTGNPGIQRVATLIAKLLRMPFVSVSLAPEAGTQRVGAVGLPMERTLSGVPFMQATRDCGRSFAVCDISKDSRFVAHPRVVGPPFFRSAICAPLWHKDGWFLGHAAGWDTEPRTFGDEDIQLLESLVEIVVDELEFHRVQTETSERAQLLQGMFENAAVGISINRLDGTRLAVNAVYANMMGYNESEFIDTDVYNVIHSEDRGQGRSLLKQLVASDIPSYQRELRYVKKDGTVFWGRTTVSLMAGGPNQVPLVIAITENIEESRQAREGRRLLLGEINHRVKNTLAIVQGIAKQILRMTTSASEFTTAFETRLHALSKSHDMLTNSSWRPLPLEEIVKDIFAGIWEPYESRVEFSGPRVELNAQTTVMLGLLLNELMTNAIKYGALKSRAGLIKIEGTVQRRQDRDWLHLAWRETGVCDIMPTERKGLGLYLIERGAKLGLGGEGRLEFLPKGILCEICFPVYSEASMSRRDLLG